MFRGFNAPSVSVSFNTFKIVASRVASEEPSAPSGRISKYFRHNPPASVMSNSASFKLPAPKSMARKDFGLFNMSLSVAFRPKKQFLALLLRQSYWLQEIFSP